MLNKPVNTKKADRDDRLFYLQNPYNTPPILRLRFYSIFEIINKNLHWSML